MKMRCKTTGSIIDVHRHYITKNLWEYFIEKPDENGRAFALVIGNETELGYVDVNEIIPFVILSGDPEEDRVYPAPNWTWLAI